MSDLHFAERLVGLPYQELPGISKRALSEHVDLWKGYVEKTAQASRYFLDQGMTFDSDDLRNATRIPAGNARDAAVLHRLYFEGLVPGGGAVLDTNAPFARTVVRQYGSVSAWWSCMREAAMSVRGWAVAGLGLDGRLSIWYLNDHDLRAFDGTPLVVVDVFEHAYWMDHGTRRQDYLDTLPKSLNWPVLEARYAKGLR